MQRLAWARKMAPNIPELDAGRHSTATSATPPNYSFCETSFSLGGLGGTTRAGGRAKKLILNAAAVAAATTRSGPLDHMICGRERGGKSHKRPLRLLSWLQVPSSSKLCWPSAHLSPCFLVSDRSSSAAIAGKLLGASLTRQGSARPRLPPAIRNPVGSNKPSIPADLCPITENPNATLPGCVFSSSPPE